MDTDFDSILSKAEIGRWKVKENLITAESELYFDDQAEKMFGIPKGLTPKETYDFWFNNIADDYKQSIKQFVDTALFNNMNFEKQYLWSSPEKGDAYFRFTGVLSEKSEEFATFGGIVTNITILNNTKGISYAETQNLERLTYYLQRQNMELIEILGEVVEFRNMEPKTHIKCVKQLTRLLANYVSKHYPEYGITPGQARLIANASPLHDIGKISISDMVLLKPGRLTKPEYELMKTHPRLGAEMIATIMANDSSSYKQFCSEIALSHHERYDGSGYPDGLVGDEIPISAQIVSLADVYDLLITPRLYKGHYTMNQAYNMIIHGECGAFNPKLLNAFTAIRADFERIVKNTTKIVNEVKP